MALDHFSYHFAAILSASNRGRDKCQEVIQLLKHRLSFNTRIPTLTTVCKRALPVTPV